MTFLPTGEQRAFAGSLDAMLTAADTPTAARAWASGDPAPARALWKRLAAAGVFALAAPEAYEGLGLHPVELAHAFVELGRHAVPGPLAETVAAAVLLTELARLGDEDPAKRLLPALASGAATATLALVDGPGADGRAGPHAPGPEPDSTPDAAPGPGFGRRGAGRPGGYGPGRHVVPYALDADRADAVLVVRGEELWQAPGHGPVRVSADPVRRLARPAPGGELLAAGPAVAAAAGQARRWAMLATAAQSLGVGLALLDRTVGYARQRVQFGTPVGAFQAVKHRLADTLLGLEFARPLLFGAAVTLTDADLAAAKVTTGEAAYAAARTALQVHGAIGYTEELDLSLWLRKARPLRDAWGDPARCRALVLDTAP
ncbi:acyl-CoA dehydrogenase family protein [Streptomyces sp. NPDC059534]|uniref:acyl-CoA dehydrogenase family protein n=1 Tax=Streptomyces sp. NPDC059534 TaxID=3346859 RepID=UPI0036C23414